MGDQIACEGGRVRLETFDASAFQAAGEQGGDGLTRGAQRARQQVVVWGAL